MVKLNWLGHACFKITADNYIIIIDPYEPGSVPGLKPLKEQADLVLCTHGHHDHCAESEIGKIPGRENPFKISCIDTFHDEVQGAKRGTNKIYIIEGLGLKLVHMGDIGCELPPGQADLLKGADVLMIPVGGFFTIDAAQASAMADQIGARVTIPMHFRGEGFGYDVIGPVSAFTALRDKTELTDGALILSENMPARTLVMRPEYL